MKANNIDHFEITLRDICMGEFPDLLDWIAVNYVECSRITGNNWLVTGGEDAVLMKLRWGWDDAIFSRSS